MFEHMKNKLSRRRTGKEESARARKGRRQKRVHRVQCLHRTGEREFSCGFDEKEAFLVEESLDEREKRG